MTIALTQESIDHIEAAQQRVAAETRILVKRATLTITGSSVALPDELVRIEGIYDGTQPLTQFGVPDYLGIVSGSVVDPTDDTDFGFLIIGRTLYVWPAPTKPKDLTVIYSYRPSSVSSDTALTLTGVAERLVERVASAYQLLDDGQPELGQQELSDYVDAAKQLRRRDRGGTGPRSRLAISRVRP